MKVALIGHFGVGKDTASEYLKEKHNFEVVSIYQPLRKLALEIFGTQKRQELNKLGFALSSAFGNDIFIWWCSKQITQNKHYVIKDARFKNEIEWLSSVCDALIYLNAKPEVVFERIKIRGREGDPKTLEELKTLWEEEGEIESAKHLANFVLDNNGEKQKLFCELDKILERFEK
jgi:dephospho-CoA kinase